MSSIAAKRIKQRVISTVTQELSIGGIADDNSDSSMSISSGVVTFSSSPIVPTPTTSTQVSNKQYVDNKVAPLASTSYVDGKVSGNVTSVKSLTHPYATPITVTSWSYVTTTITLNVASHNFVASDTIEVQGLTTTDTGTGSTSTYVPNGIWIVSSVTSTTIVYSVVVAPTVTNKSVSSATVKGVVTVNGVYGGVGVGQTWQDVTASRVLGTTYTNSTGKPVFINVTGNNTNACTYVLYIGGVAMCTTNDSASAGRKHIASGIVPNGATYRLTGDAGSLASGSIWSELR